MIYALLNSAKKYLTLKIHISKHRCLTKKMESRNLKITLISASNLPNVREFGDMKVYAVVCINFIPATKHKTETDKIRGVNPRWDEAVNYTVSDFHVREGDLFLVVALFCKRTFGDKFLGYVLIPVENLYNLGLKSDQVHSCPVVGTENGTLDFKYSFGDIFVPPKASFDWGKAAKMAHFGLNLIEAAGQLLS